MGCLTREYNPEVRRPAPLTGTGVGVSADPRFRKAAIMIAAPRTMRPTPSQPTQAGSRLGSPGERTIPARATNCAATADQPMMRSRAEDVTR